MNCCEAFAQAVRVDNWRFIRRRARVKQPLRALPYNSVRYVPELGEDMLVFPMTRSRSTESGALNPDELTLSLDPRRPAEAGICFAAIGAFIA